MTNEKMLEVLLSIKADLEYNDAFPGMTWKTMPEAIAQLQEDIRHDCQKKKGNVKRDNLLKKLMKNNHTARAETWGSHYTPYGEQFGFLDGYRAYVLNDSYGYPKIEGDPFNLESCKPKGKSVSVHVDLADLETHIKTERALGHRANGRYGAGGIEPYALDAGDFKIRFNPVYLLEFCQMFATDTIQCFGHLHPALYEAENGEWGIVLPVRLVEKEW